jgi:hypothetical protein
MQIDCDPTEMKHRFAASVLLPLWIDGLATRHISYCLIMGKREHIIELV